MSANEQFDPNPNSRELICWIKQHFGVHVSVPATAESFEHQTTHHRIHFVLWRTCAVNGRLGRGAGIWRKLDAIDDLPLSNPQRRVVQTLREID